MAMDAADCVVPYIQVLSIPLQMAGRGWGSWGLVRAGRQRQVTTRCHEDVMKASFPRRRLSRATFVDYPDLCAFSQD